MNTAVLNQVPRGDDLTRAVIELEEIDAARQELPMPILWRSCGPS
jgi:hypothetical protein